MKCKIKTIENEFIARKFNERGGRNDETQQKPNFTTNYKEKGNLNGVLFLVPHGLFVGVLFYKAVSELLELAM